MMENNTNILVICPVFHGYENRILSCIRQSKKYSKAYLIKDTPLVSEKQYLMLNNAFPKLCAQLLKLFNNRVIKKIRDNKIDTLFIVKGKYMLRETVSLIQKKHPEIRIVLYEWDSIFSNPNALNLLDVISESYTFDFEDAKKEKRFKYLPLFYSFDQLPSHKILRKDIDFLFIGGFSLERMPIITKIRELCEKEGWQFTSHLYVPYSVYVKHKSLMHPYKNIISFKSLEYEKYYSLVCRAKAVVDIVSADQTGLTIRTIEALSQHCHLLTTNYRIKEMDFYTERNITIIDNDKIKSDVFRNALEQKFDDGYNKTIYSTKEWLEKMTII